MKDLSAVHEVTERVQRIVQGQRQYFQSGGGGGGGVVILNLLGTLTSLNHNIPRSCD